MLLGTLFATTATVEFVEGVCFLKKRELRIDELTAQADVSKQDMEPGGYKNGAIVAGHRERIRSNLNQQPKNYRTKGLLRVRLACVRRLWRALRAASPLIASL